MGNASTKAARTAASAAKRKYPEQPSPATTQTTPRPPPVGRSSLQGPTVHPQPSASETRDEFIDLDASDPQFAASLRSLGPVTPSSTLSNSSHFPPSPLSAPSTNPSSTSHQVFPDPSQNPAIQVLTARENLAKEAEAEFARVRYEGGGGKRFLDVMTIRQILMFRDEKKLAGADIEKKLGLATGTVARLGPRGVVGEAGTAVG